MKESSTCKEVHSYNVVNTPQIASAWCLEKACACEWKTDRNYVQLLASDSPENAEPVWLAGNPQSQ